MKSIWHVLAVAAMCGALQASAVNIGLRAAVWHHSAHCAVPAVEVGVAVQVNGNAVEFETAADGRTRMAAVAAGTAVEDVKVYVGGVDVTAGFRVSVEGTTATVALLDPCGVARQESASHQVWTDNGDETVSLNVEIVPGLYYAADSAATLDAFRCPGAARPANAGDSLSVRKQSGDKGFYKIWVSDAPIKPE